MIYSGFFCGSGEGSSLVEVLVVDGGAKIGYIRENLGGSAQKTKGCNGYLRII